MSVRKLFCQLYFIGFIVLSKSEFDQEMPKSHTAGSPNDTVRKRHSAPTATWHQEENLSKAGSSLFKIKKVYLRNAKSDNHSPGPVVGEISP